MKDLEKKFFEYQVQEKMKFYGMTREQAECVVKRIKTNSILWKVAMDAWFDQIHPY